MQSELWLREHRYIKDPNQRSYFGRQRLDPGERTGEALGGLDSTDSICTSYSLPKLPEAQTRVGSDLKPEEGDRHRTLDGMIEQQAEAKVN